MRIIKPNKIGEMQLVSSTIPAVTPEDGAAWSSTAAYDVGALVHELSVRRRYRAAAANTGVNPATDTSDPPAWVDMGPMARWAMFDGAIGTVSNVDAGPLTVILRPGSIDSIALFELTGTEVSVVMRERPGGVVVYERSTSLMWRQISSFYEWFFVPYEYRYDAVFGGMPMHFHSCESEITITPAHVAACGECVVGRSHKIGGTQYGATSGIIDFSRKDRNEKFGAVTVRERRYSKRATFSVMTRKSDFNRIHRLLAEVRATLCVYVGTDCDGYEPLTIYGFYRDFGISVDYPQDHLLTIDIEGIV